jgi:hypothetical protein
MATNPVEENFVTRYILGLGVILAMMVGGRAVGSVFGSTGISYGGPLGVVLGAALVFVVFTMLYRRYDRSHRHRPR